MTVNDCQEHQRLLKDYTDARTRFEAANVDLRTNGTAASPSEFAEMLERVRDANRASIDAYLAFQRHIVDHQCAVKPNGQPGLQN